VPQLSAIVITLNEEDSILRCLRSLSFADELIVVDSGSTDRTLEIARSCGATVLTTKDWPGFGPQKNRALEAATGDWVLSLDADEWVGPQLAAEILRTIASPDAASGYNLPRRSRFCGTVVNYCGWWPDYVLRLFRRDRGRFSERAVHERVIVNGRVAQLSEPIEHDAIVDMAEAEEKSERYAAAAAEEMHRQGIGANRFAAPFHAGIAFFRTYILQQGFLDGLTGWHVANYNRRYTYRKWKALYDLRR
jgi:glycosyltransferase involved in cell wall biosynthesis